MGERKENSGNQDSRRYRIRTAFSAAAAFIFWFPERPFARHSRTIGNARQQAASGKPGYYSSISSVVTPPARRSEIRDTQILCARMQGYPKQTLGSIDILGRRSSRVIVLLPPRQRQAGIRPRTDYDLSTRISQTGAGRQGRHQASFGSGIEGEPATGQSGRARARIPPSKLVLRDGSHA